jgi:hypothetical protein
MGKVYRKKKLENCIQRKIGKVYTKEKWEKCTQRNEIVII